MGVMTVGERDPASRTYQLGPRLKAARIALDLSQHAAAAKAGISNMAWNMLERGVYRRGGEDVPVTKPQLESVLKAAHAVGIDSREAIQLSGIRSAPGVDAYELPIEAIDEEIASKTARLTTTQRARFRRIVNEILDAMLYAEAPSPNGGMQVLSSTPEAPADAIESGVAEPVAGEERRRSRTSRRRSF